MFHYMKHCQLKADSTVILNLKPGKQLATLDIRKESNEST